MTGEKIPNTLYHIDKRIDQHYDTKKNADEGMTSEKIPDTTLITILTNYMTLSRSQTRVRWVN